MSTIEEATADLLNRHRLSSIHLFTRLAGWRVFGFKPDAKGFEASIESGTGSTILEALNDLDARIKEGPIHKDTPS